MTQVKVRFALANYTAKDIYGNDYTANAFRGEVIDIANPAELQRLRLMGAVVDPSINLERPGRMISLPESPSDEELLAWVAAAADDEIRHLAAERPNLVPRLVGAQEVANRSHQEQLRLLGRAQEIATKHVGDNVTQHAMSGAVGPEPINTGTDPDVIFATPPYGSQVPPAAGGGDPTVPGDPTAGVGEPGWNPDGTAIEGGGDSEPSGDPATGDSAPGPATGESNNTDAQLDAVVDQNSDTVKAYIADHPREAAAILQAENRAAERHGREPRVGVIRAVEAALAHTQ